MKGKYFGIYDLKDNEQCIGVFESVDEICRFFRITNQNRIHESVHRKTPLAFHSKRYEVVSFAEPTVGGVKKQIGRAHV